MAFSIQQLCDNYVSSTDLILPEEIDDIADRFPTQPHRRTSLELYPNIQHLHHVRHHATGTEFIYCYVPRLRKVSRILSYLKILFPDFVQDKLLKPRSHPAFQPIMDYMPDFLVAQGNSRVAKDNKETFSSKFMVLVKKNGGQGGHEAPLSDFRFDFFKYNDDDDDDENNNVEITNTMDQCIITTTLAPAPADVIEAPVNFTEETMEEDQDVAGDAPSDGSLW